MAIKYEPSKLIEKIAPKKKIEKLVSSSATLKRTALEFVSGFDFLDAKDVTRVAAKTLKGYRKRIKDGTAEKAELVDDPRQLIQRVQNEVLLQIGGEIRSQYASQFFIWLPSDADEPDPEHQEKYGKKFQIDEDELPGERFGCRCGMEILVADSTLKLE